jgi:hypothetical protein
MPPVISNDPPPVRKASLTALKKVAIEQPQPGIDY